MQETIGPEKIFSFFKTAFLFPEYEKFEILFKADAKPVGYLVYWQAQASAKYSLFLEIVK